MPPVMCMYLGRRADVLDRVCVGDGCRGQRRERQLVQEQIALHRHHSQPCQITIHSSIKHLHLLCTAHSGHGYGTLAGRSPRGGGFKLTPSKYSHSLSPVINDTFISSTREKTVLPKEDQSVDRRRMSTDSLYVGQSRSWSCTEVRGPACRPGLTLMRV